MSMLSSLRLPALFLAVALLVAGCDGFDSGTLPTQSTGGEEATISFATDNISITEESGTVTIEVTVTNPPNDTVSAELLYADGTSSTSPSDFGLGSSRNVGSGYVAGRVVFPDTATTGNTQTLTLDIADEEDNEPKEDGVFVFQNVTNASVEGTDRLTISIGAIEIFFKDFEGGSLSPMTVFNVTSGNGWGTGTFENNSYAVANAFGGSEASNSWLISPAINFNNFEGETLTFRNKKRFDDGGEEQPLEVKVSTDYDGEGNPENFNWTDVTDRVENLAQSESFVQSGEIDLSDAQFQASEVYVAFKYTSSGTGPGTSEEQQVDDVRVVGR
ncbi:hypothetical protein GGQ08_000170 [Salinibacter ruber]|uniref:DUF5017 domain-containing protein n=1 Tax=Salinibacter ruber TaxID=146919 RepID=UPI002167E224|nr:DUF5017 domain-containing protein [Salinibacter ruber]MCS3648876.1 hypothetical protein [Salinibacter ruber]MCS3652130.1 hypothetical protein [Salinibacter ruber]